MEDRDPKRARADEVTATGPRQAVSVDELKRAWTAVKAGDFRRGLSGSSIEGAVLTSTRTSRAWRPANGERTIAVFGTAGLCGAGTVALALGVAAPPPVRVVECCSVAVSDMAAASTAELGVHESGWRQGRRDHLLLERIAEPLVRVADVPNPIETDHECQLTILGVGWDVAEVLATDCWLRVATRAADAVVVVTNATVPGMRRLEIALELLGDERAVMAVVGPRRRRWPKGVERSAAPATRRALDCDRWVAIPEDRDLAASGPDSRPLPDGVLTAARRLLSRLVELPTAPHAGEAFRAGSTFLRQGTTP